MTTLQAGDPAPDFTLPAHPGPEVHLGDLRGAPVVLYFYPKDGTPGCTTQACEYRDLSDAFAEKGARVFGISRDSLASHERFAQKQGLTFPLLSDPDLAVHRAYGAYGEKTMYGKKTMGVLRTAVVIDEEGVVVSVKRGVRAGGNAERTLKLL